MVTEKSREIRLRRMAERQGLTIQKSRRRDPRAIDYGKWWVVHSDQRFVELKDIDSLESYLTGPGRATTDYYVDIDTPERLEIGPVASPSDLAYPLAHTLILIEKQGAARPRYKAHADDDEGNTSELTEVEQDEFDAALQQALGVLEGTIRKAN